MQDAELGADLRAELDRVVADARAITIPTVRGELQHHSPGCYPTHSGIKRWMRRAENELGTAEGWSALSRVVTGHADDGAPGLLELLHPQRPAQGELAQAHLRHLVRVKAQLLAHLSQQPYVALAVAPEGEAAPQINFARLQSFTDYAMSLAMPSFRRSSAVTRLVSAGRTWSSASSPTGSCSK